jgi:hypothetical protein
MDPLSLTIVGSLIAAGIFGLARIAVKRHLLLVALSQEVEWQRGRLTLFQQVIREVALTKSFEGPMVLPGYKRYDSTRFDNLIHQVLPYAPSVHTSLAVFSDRVRDIEMQFEEFAQLLRLDPRGEASGRAIPREYIASNALRILTASETVLRETSNRELVAFPVSYHVDSPDVLVERLCASIENIEPIRLLTTGSSGVARLRPRELVIDVAPLDTGEPLLR